MDNSVDQRKTWRNDPGLNSISIYKKRFAILPVLCEGGKKVWLEFYYKKYINWFHSYKNIDDYGHIEFVENISTSEYIIRKLAEAL